MTHNQLPKAVMSYQLTTLERVANLLETLDLSFEARS